MRRALTSSLALFSLGTLLLAGCGQSGTDAAAESSASGSQTITVQTNTGEVEVPADPQRVVVLDNTSFHTLKAFGVEPVAVPKPLLPPGFEEWESDDAIGDAGSHREANLEAVNAAEPDLIIGGKRFADYSDQLGQIAPVVDLAPNVEEGEYIENLKSQTTTLGEIFDKAEQAEQINAELDAAVAEARTRTDGQSVFLANHNGGKIDNGAGRLSPIIQPLTMTDVFAATSTGGSESIHQDSGLAPETVAQANPDWIIVMDRDAVSSEDPNAATAQQTVQAQTAWSGVTAVNQNQIVYLAADFYVTEGIQAYTDAYRQIAQVPTS